jgi:hypothetical protein
LEYKWGLEYYTNVCKRKEKWNNMAQGRDLENMRDKEMTSERQMFPASRG